MHSSGNDGRTRDCAAGERSDGEYTCHPKNWSLWYPKPAEGQLSPAYDILAYNVYDHSDEMALSFRGTRNSRIMNVARFKRASSLVSVTEARVTKEVRKTVELAFETWPDMLRSLPPPPRLTSVTAWCH